ncbi:hypothetical protein FOA52_010691 [Chlamydomonas sp. UWO 241]|nr:hypothetical protein FOA52_010691 [Chlamydomonas sp. UWO 241]
MSKRRRGSMPLSDDDLDGMPGSGVVSHWRSGGYQFAGYNGAISSHMGDETITYSVDPMHRTSFGQGCAAAPQRGFGCGGGANTAPLPLLDEIPVDRGSSGGGAMDDETAAERTDSFMRTLNGMFKPPKPADGACDVGV